jgi:hypothetical protein
MPRLDRQKRNQRHWILAQLSLPLDCSQSEPAVLSQSPAPSKVTRARRQLDRLGTNLTKPELPGTVEASCDLNSEENYFRQGKRFVLTSTLSTLITEVNGKRWPRNVSALPTFGKGEVAKFSEGRPFVGRGSLSDLQACTLGRH